jgi:hypothetical protein
VLRVVAEPWPLASLLLHRRNNSPYDVAVRNVRESQVLGYLLETMRGAAHSLTGDMIEQHDLPLLIKDESFETNWCRDDEHGGTAFYSRQLYQQTPRRSRLAFGCRQSALPLFASA